MARRFGQTAVVARRVRLLRTAVAAVGSRGPAVAQVSHMLTSSGAQRLRHRLWLAAPSQV